MTEASLSVSRAAVRGIASGVFFMSLFGMLWAYTGIMGLSGWGMPFLLVIAVAIGIALCIGGIFLMRASRELTKEVSEPPEFLDGRRTRYWFNFILAAEGLAIAIAIAVCRAISHTELIPPVIALIVGVHFFPLAPLFQVRLYYLTGTLLCLIAIFTMVFMPLEVGVGEYQINTFMSVVGLGSAFILWGTGLAIWIMGRRLLADVQNN